MTLRIIVGVLVGLGAFFALAGTVGMLRMPDAYCRMQSSTNVTTLGLLFALLGALIYAIFGMHSWAASVKIVVIGVVSILANPAAGHAICRAAHRKGVPMDGHTVCDALKEGEENA